MASKFGMAGGIPERRVRPIWDAIDSRQFKNALKHSATLLSKYPNSPYALALKALILERMGKSEEAFSVSLNAKELLFKNDSILIDDLTLSTLQIVFQRLDHLDVATSCYEYACGKFANNLELMMGLFNCYVREYAFVKQQQIAIRMYKIVGEERYLLWAVCSIQLQVFWGNGGDKLLLLAEGLLKKHIASHSLHEPEALTVYISVLEQQSKYGDALELISGKLGSLMVIEVDKLRVQGNLLARAGDFSAAADIFKKVLELCPDDWECFLHYLGCLLEDNTSWLKDSITDSIHPPKSIACKCELSDDLFESRISDASAFVQKLAAEQSNDNIRCPYLATLEIERRKLLFGKGDVCAFIDSLLTFSSRFGHLTCFSSDVEVFLQILPPDKKIELLVKLRKNIESLATTPSKLLGHSITLFKIRESVGDMFNLPSTDLEDFAVEMVEMYCKNLPLSKDLDIQESMHGEELLTMACNILVQLYWRTRDLGYLLESIMILEFGLTIRRHVSQYKILLLHLYSHWGATSLAYEWYKSLEVKNILLETVSHHILPQMLISPLWVDLDDILGDYLRFMDDHLRESADLTSLAYRHRNYSKVIEFVRFKERLQRSSQYLMAKLELSILQMKQNSNTIEEEEHVIERLKDGVEFDALSSEIGSQSLTFNEDLQLRPWWTPTYDKNYLLGPFDGISYCPRENLEDQIKESRINGQKTMEKRSLIPRLVYLSVQCAAASSSVKEKLESNGSSSTTKLSLEMKILLDRYANILGFSFHDAVELAFGVSSGKNSLEAFGSNTADWINFAVFLNAWNLNDSELVLQDKTSKKPDTWHLVNSLIEKYITQNLKSTGPILSTPGSDLPVIIQLVTEPLSWHGLIIQSCIRSSQPPGKKKKKGGPAEHLNPQILHDARDSIKAVCVLLEEVTKWLREQIDKPVDEAVETLVFPLKGKDKNCGVPGKLFSLLENFVSSMHESDLGERISRELRSWCSTDVARKLVGGQKSDLNDFLRICDLKMKSLRSLKVQT